MSYFLCEKYPKCHKMDEKVIKLSLSIVWSRIMTNLVKWARLNMSSSLFRDPFRSMSNFPWLQHFSLNSDVNWQAKTFTEIILNIMSNFVPNEVKKTVPRDPPWFTKPLKSMLNRKNRLFKNYKRHGYKEEDKLRLENFHQACKYNNNYVFQFTGKN